MSSQNLVSRIERPEDMLCAINLQAIVSEILLGRFRKRHLCLKGKRIDIFLHIIKVGRNGARIGGRFICAWSHAALQKASEKQQKNHNPHGAESCVV